MSAIDAASIVTAVRRRYGCETDDLAPEWSSLDEMDLQPGYSTRRIDLLMIRAWRGKRGHERHSVEVKVSRADLRRELEQPEKWRAWADVTHRFYLAVPADLSLDGLELPDPWGIYTVDGRGTRLARKAEHRDDVGPLPNGVITEAFRRASRAEARIREAATRVGAHEGNDLAAQIAALTRDLTSAQRATVTARQAEDRWQRRCDEVMRLLALLDPAPVCQCGEPLKRLRRGSIRWEHAAQAGKWGDRECRWPRIDTDALAERVLPDELLADAG